MSVQIRVILRTSGGDELVLFVKDNTREAQEALIQSFQEKHGGEHRIEDGGAQLPIVSQGVQVVEWMELLHAQNLLALDQRIMLSAWYFFGAQKEGTCISSVVTLADVRGRNGDWQQFVLNDI